MALAVEVLARVHISGLDREALTNVFFGMGDVLSDVEDEVSDVLDHAVSIDLGRKLIQIEVTARGASVEEADTLAKACVLVAVKATGGSPANADQLRQFALSGTSVVDELAAHDIDITSHELVLA